MAIDYMNDIGRAKAAIRDTINDLKFVADNLPDGLAKVVAISARANLITAILAISFRRPGVPCRLDFVALEK